MDFGPLVTRVAGTVEPPVTSSEPGVVVTGVAGGAFTFISVDDKAAAPAESRIAFQSDRNGGHQIFLMSGNGGPASRINTGGSVDFHPALSPDGTRIAFASTRGGNTDIYSIRTDGTGIARLTTSTAADAEPAWSPDGTKIAFVSFRDGNAEIYTMLADGSGQTRVTTNDGSDAGPTWSPDGTQIAFETDRDGSHDIWTMLANGAAPKRLTFVGSSLHPSWSPDGTRIAFESTRDGNSEVYVMLASTGAFQTRLTNDPLPDQDPTWSPDSERIAYMRTAASNTEIFSIGADGSGRTPLTNHIAQDTTPSWAAIRSSRPLVGPDGTIAVSASGFLFGQSGAELRSIVVFDATTRTSARVRAETGQGAGAPNLVFAVSADRLTRLVYMAFGDVIPRPVTVIGAGGIPGATDVLVSFDSRDGRVVSVIPFVSNRSGDLPQGAAGSGERILHGRFLGAWDAAGVNHAPNGASEIHLDSRTGQITAAH